MSVDDRQEHRDNWAREWGSEQKKEGRKEAYYCLSQGTRGGVNSDSFQRDGQLNLRAALLRAMAILLCLRLPLWTSTESSI